MRTSLSALLLAAAFVTTAGAAKAQSLLDSTEYSGRTAIEFATKSDAFRTQADAPVQRPAPVFTSGQNRGIYVNPTNAETSGK